MEVIEKTINGSSACEVQLRDIFKNFLEHDEEAQGFFKHFTRQRSEILNQLKKSTCKSLKFDSVEGKYCTASLRATSTIPKITFGNFSISSIFPDPNKTFADVNLCVPKSCSAGAIGKFGNKLGENHFRVSDMECDEDSDSGAFDIFVILIFVFLLTLLLLSTIYDVFRTNAKKETNEVLTSFSVYSNFKKLVVNETSETTISCINGIKALSALWIVLGHRRYFSFTKSKNHGPMWFDVFQTFVDGHNFAVDSFLTCTAIVATQSILRKFECDKFKLLKFYLSRYLRYIPSLGLITFLFLSSLSRKLVDGDEEQVVILMCDKCKTDWWRNFLLIQNFGEIVNTCLNHTWYLALDFQLSIIMPFVVYSLYVTSKSILGLIVIILSLEMWSFHQLYNNHIPYNYQFYEFTQYRIAQMIIGVIAGYIFHKFSTRRIEFKCLTSLTAWTLSISFLVLHIIFKPDHIKHTTVGGYLYESIWRELWACSIAWIVFACHQLGSGGIIRWFLNLDMWQPLSRMSLSIYLVNFLYVKLTLVNQQTVPSLSPWWQIHIYAGDILVTLILGTMMHLLIEAPMMRLLNPKSLKIIKKMPSKTIMMLRMWRIQIERDGDDQDICVYRK